jgi:two-component system sensor histidine kinase PilS (NtrC family)
MRTGPSLPPLGPPAPRTDAELETLWRPVQYFAAYRLLVATFFLAAIKFGGDALNVGAQNPRLFEWASIAYLAAALFLWVTVLLWRRAFNTQLSIHVATDVTALTLMMHASGGSQSGVSVMIFVVLAGAGLVGQGRLTLFHASLATMAVLAEQGYRVLVLDGDAGAFFRVGLTSIGFFATAITARLLGRRIIAQEALAKQRGIELARQLRISEAVIRDMQDGVLVVDASGRIGQHNPQAALLLDAADSDSYYLAELSPELAEHFVAWQAGAGRSEANLRAPQSGRLLRARCRASGAGGFTLIYLEDMGRVEAQARQLKLAALGRLTANMAHEIRNPLSSISHAAELLAEDTQNDTERRLASIIGDNTQRLNRLVAEVMELGRRDRAQPEQFSLGAFLTAFVDEYAVSDPAAKRRIALLVAEPSEICFDRSHLHRVLWNLLVNAMRHASAGDEAVRIEVSARDAAKPVELHIIDDGPGVPPEQAGQVFEPFFTTHGSGTGLGLYIARELCEANGAQLDLLDDRPGAHFRMSFGTEACRTHGEIAAS